MHTLFHISKPGFTPFPNLGFSKNIHEARNITAEFLNICGDFSPCCNINIIAKLEYNIFSKTSGKS